MDPLLIVTLSIANFFLAFIAVSAGGSGLVMTPLMVSLGIPPTNAIAAKRFANLGISTFSLPRFYREGKVVLGLGLTLMAATIISSFIAANIIISMDQEVLKRIIGVLVIGILIFTFFNKKLGIEKGLRRMGRRNKVLGFIIYMGIVFLANFVGGSGLLTSFILISFFGLTFLEAAGTRKLAGFLGTLTSVIIYIFAGVMIFELAIPLFITASLGGVAGTHFALKKGDVWVRKLFMVIIVILGIRLLFF
jgi:uncharacterized membrane protein YfcA